MNVLDKEGQEHCYYIDDILDDVSVKIYIKVQRVAVDEEVKGSAAIRKQVSSLELLEGASRTNYLTSCFTKGKSGKELARIKAGDHITDTQMAMKRQLDLFNDTELYEVSRAPAGCYNMLVGQKVYNSPFEMMVQASKVSKAGHEEAFSSYFADGGLQHSTLEYGNRFPYLDIDANLRPINVVPGAYLTSLQLQLM